MSKTYKNLFSKIINPENLLTAFHQAEKQKRFRSYVLLFEENLGMNILNLHKALKEKTYQPGKYKFFKTFDPKERIIAAAPFVDRIVHHALHNIIEPILDKRFIYNSFACRKEKGTHRGVKRLQQLLRKKDAHYALKCDVSKYFPSINHKKISKIPDRIIRDKETMWLLKEIINSYETGNEYNHLFLPDSHYNTKKPRGIPVGNLTSQLLANIYLNELDQFVKQELKVKYYLRYVDDFLVLGPNKQYLHQLVPKIKHFLYDKFYLTLHPKKISIFPIHPACPVRNPISNGVRKRFSNGARLGVDFLGYVVFKDFVLIRKSNVKKFRKKLLKFKKSLNQGKTKEEKVRESITSWLAHAQHADTYRLRKRIFGKPLEAKHQKEIKEFVKNLKEKSKRPVQLSLF